MTTNEYLKTAKSSGDLCRVIVANNQVIDLQSRIRSLDVVDIPSSIELVDASQSIRRNMNYLRDCGIDKVEEIDATLL